MIKKFETGVVMVSMEAMKALSKREIRKAIKRHQSCDWGESGYMKEQEAAIRRKQEIVSVYRSYSKDQPYFVITDDDHTFTFVLMPEEYYGLC